MAFVTGTLSPVRAASSILSDALSSRRPSAGTASPASSSTTSPGTSRLLSSTRCSPPRSTLHFAAVMVCSASMAASALLSCTTPSTALSSTTARMMNTSVKLSPESAFVAADTAAAAIRMSSIGSFSCWKKRWRSVAFGASCSLFGPCRSRRAVASSAVRPDGEE